LRKIKIRIVFSKKKSFLIHRADINDFRGWMVGLKVGLQYKGGSSNPVGVTIFLKTFVLGRFNKKNLFFQIAVQGWK